MYIVLSIVFFFVVVAATYQVVQRVLRPMENATDRRWLTGVSCAVSVVASVLLLSCAFLPYKMDNALEEGISAFEQSLESVSPDICHEELSPDRLRQLCSDSRSIKGYIEENADVNFVVRTWALTAMWIISLRLQTGWTDRWMRLNRPALPIPYTMYWHSYDKRCSNRFGLRLWY